VFEYTEEASPAGLKLAEELCNAALQDTPFDLAAALGQLRELDEDVRLGLHRRDRARCVARNILPAA